MNSYTEHETCPICGTRSTYQVRTNGDYDSPERPRESNPNECKVCAALKQANPYMYDLSAKLWSKLLGERELARRHIEKLDMTLFSDEDLFAPVRDNPMIWEELAKKWRKDLAAQQRISRDVGNKEPEKDSWCLEKTLEGFYYHIMKMVEKEKARV